MRAVLIGLAWVFAAGTSAASVPAPVSGALRVQTVATGLEHPWALAFLPEGGYLVTERPGRMRIVDEQGRLGPALEGLPEVAVRGQGGLLDLALDTGFERNRTLYFCFSEPAEGGTNSTALARARLPAGSARLEDVRVIFSQQPRVASPLHFGCRIVQMPDGHLVLALGERYHRMQEAQKLDNHLGKVVRLTSEGAPAPGNPWIGRAGARPETGAMDIATRKGPPWGPTVGSGCTSTGRRAATKSTCLCPGAITGGQWSPSASNMAADR